MGKHSKHCLAAITLMCLLLGGCGEQADVVMVNSEKEANLILVEFENRGIASPSKSQLTVDRKIVWSIRCSPEQASQARQILVKLDLPREERGGLESMINSTGLIPTKTDERAKLMHATAQELETTFETYDRVVRARVHVVIPDTDMSLTADPAKAPQPSATVLLKYRVRETAADKSDSNPNAAGPPMKEEDVQQIVAKSVAGLESTNVFVTFTSTEVTAPIVEAPVAVAGSKKMLYQLFAAVALLGVFCIFLIVKLLKKSPSTAATPAGAAG